MNTDVLLAVTAFASAVDMRQRQAPPAPTSPVAASCSVAAASSPVVTAAPRVLVQRRHIEQRQNYPTCDDVGNNILSCYPTSNVTVVQGEWTRFVWNHRYPEYIGYGNLDIYLFHADSDVAAANWTNIPNSKGLLGVSVNDEFWGTRGVTGWRDGQNQTMPFYFLAVSAGATLDGGEPRQSTFTAVQTRLPDYYSQSLTSAASLASLSTLSTLSTSSAALSPTGSAGGSLQNGAGNDSFPKWAIALLVILGALALAALLLLAWLSARNLRTRQRRRSTGSSTPIMAVPAAHAPDSASPVHDAPGASLVGRPVSLRRGPGSMGAGGIHAGTDGASTRSGETGPISGQDAAIMASAFRARLRKPDFATRPDEEGESPEERDAREQTELLKEQLAEEGRDIQSVRSERGVRVYNSTAEDGSEDGGPWSATPRPATPRR
ncbi:hypothetical protein CTheo_5873 [Ceratobasidium theobromae]|uniref:Transmembrane protein n=1 Tax=Ceratobasidium theobromae TaxID=1582974 RepID=A0A5N5QHB4_9AGAM|nr:hypothetical protein CTheo_5873 [Ceratobasidium theobromae]